MLLRDTALHKINRFLTSLISPGKTLVSRDAKREVLTYCWAVLYFQSIELLLQVDDVCPSFPAWGLKLWCWTEALYAIDFPTYPSTCLTESIVFSEKLKEQN